MTPIGIIGCGGHAQHHAENHGHKFMVATVWDPDPEMAARIPSIIGPAATLEDLLACEHITAVMICSPDEYHLTQIEQALAAGKHVFCEKPLLVPGEPLERLVRAFDLAREKKLVVTSCHPRRYDKPIWWLWDRIDPRSQNPELLLRFGRVMSFSFDFSYHRPSHEWKHSRSLLLDHLNHEVDLMNMLFGIQGFDAWKLHDGPDHYAVVGKRDDGIAFHFQGTRRLEQSVYPEWCRVRFERGEVTLDMRSGVASIFDHETGETETVSGSGLKTDYSGRLERVMYDFVREIDGDSSGYLKRPEMLMNTEVGIVLQQDGPQRINVRS